MKPLYCFITFILSPQLLSAQQVVKMRTDSLRIYNTTDTAELILENRTKDTLGFLYNKGNGRTEFRRAELVNVGDSALAIKGQDTMDIRSIGLLNLGTLTLVMQDTTIGPEQRFVGIASTDVSSIYLPPASLCRGKVFVFKVLHAPTGSPVLLRCSGTDKIDGSVQLSVGGYRTSLQLYCDGTQWLVIAVYSRYVIAWQRSPIISTTV